MNHNKLIGMEVIAGTMTSYMVRFQGNVYYLKTFMNDAGDMLLMDVVDSNGKQILEPDLWEHIVQLARTPIEPNQESAH